MNAQTETNATRKQPRELQCDTCFKPPLDPETERSGQQCRRKYGGNNKRCPGVLMTVDESTNALFVPRAVQPSVLRSPQKVRALTASDLGLDPEGLICDTCRLKPRAGRGFGDTCLRYSARASTGSTCRGTIRKLREGERHAELPKG
jgi:hypothetical protein